MPPTLPAALAVLAVAALAGCAPAPAPLVVASLPAPPVASPHGTLLPGQRQATFVAWPQTLLTAARAACSDPGQTPREPAPGIVLCETLPTPDIAATLILGYGGTVEALPLYIISFTTVAQEAGYLVTADSFVSVPQTDGTLREVRLPDPRVEEDMMQLLVAAGGTPT
jgi:hypothetical protein